MGTAIKHTLLDRVKPSFVIFDIWALWRSGLSVMLTAERQSARMSKITNDGLTRSSTVCFIAVPIWHQWASKGYIIYAEKHTIFFWSKITVVIRTSSCVTRNLLSVSSTSLRSMTNDGSGDDTLAWVNILRRSQTDSFNGRDVANDCRPPTFCHLHIIHMH